MLPLLTDREEQVLKLIACGLTNRGISSQLFISESTVENHIHSIYSKLGISNRAQAVAYAFRLTLLAHEQLSMTKIEENLHDSVSGGSYNVNVCVHLLTTELTLLEKAYVPGKFPFRFLKN